MAQVNRLFPQEYYRVIPRGSSISDEQRGLITKDAINAWHEGNVAADEVIKAMISVNAKTLAAKTTLGLRRFKTNKIE